MALFFCLCAFNQFLFAQNKDGKRDGDPIISFQFHYTYLTPAGDLADRFGIIHNAGFGGIYKSQTNWTLSLDASYQFGSEVKEENMLVNLTNSSGVIMNNAGYPASYSVGQRGFNAMAKAGKVIPLSWKNTNSGIILMLGGGIYYHKINIGTQRNDIPTLTEELKKGYDRLSMGPATTQFLGYYFHSSNRYYNFFAGLDCVQAYTQSVRQYNYDTMKPDTDKRLDLTFGLRLGWMIPVYLKAKVSQNEYEFR